MAFSIASSDNLRFRFNKTGGAKMVTRIAIFKDPSTPQQQRVRLLFMGNASSATEKKTQPPLPAGTYQIVAVTMIEEAQNGTYDYEAELNGHVFAKRSGDVNSSPGVDVEPVITRATFTVT